MIKVEFLYYDRIECKRCMAAYKSVKQAIKDAVKIILEKDV